MIVVTGGAGFIGSALVKGLNKKGIGDIIIVDILGSDLKWKNLVSLSYKDYLHRDEFLNLIKTKKFPGKIKGILHMGACSATTERDADYLMQNNFQYTKTLCTYALDKKIRFIYASSGATYGLGEQGYDDSHNSLEDLRPLNMYGYSKHLFDLWALKNKVLNKIVGVKFFNVFGPGEYHKADMRSMVLRSFEQIRDTGKVRLFKSTDPKFKDGEQKRDFIYINDCVDVVLWLLEKSKVNGIFNLGSGNARTWNDLARAAFAAMNREPKIEFFDMPKELASQYQNFTEAPMKKLRSAGYKKAFTPLEDAVSDYVTYFK